MDYLPLIVLFVAGTMTVVGCGTLVGYKRGVFTRRPQKVPAAPLLPITVCSRCGTNIPVGAEFCEKCRTPVGLAQMPAEEEKVYDYIVNHEGVISLSVASEDLGVPLEKLKEITERLKREGRLS
jgi:hypothetical protein